MHIVLIETWTVEKDGKVYSFHYSEAEARNVAKTCNGTVKRGTAKRFLSRKGLRKYVIEVATVYETEYSEAEIKKLVKTATDDMLIDYLVNANEILEEVEL